MMLRVYFLQHSDPGVEERLKAKWAGGFEMWHSSPIKNCLPLEAA